MKGSEGDDFIIHTFTTLCICVWGVPMAYRRRGILFPQKKVSKKVHFFLVVEKKALPLHPLIKREAFRTEELGRETIREIFEDIDRDSRKMHREEAGVRMREHRSPQFQIN